MLKELVALEPGKPVLRAYEDEPLKEGFVRINVEHGAPKHGTELTYYRGINPEKGNRWDSEMNVFVPQEEKGEGKFFARIGNMWVGRITEMANDVTGFEIGQRVAGPGPLKSTQTISAERLLTMRDEMTWKEALCHEPARYAMGGVRDGHVRIGDKVAVFGMGAIGLVAAQMAKLSGASYVVVVDPIEIRREAALKAGADYAIDPTAEDAGLMIKKLTGKGVDVAIETSGAYSAMHHCIRSVAFGGNVSVVGWYKECRGGINFGTEAHFNRPNIIFSRVESEPNRDYPRWDFGRIKKECWDLLQKGMINCEHIIYPVVSFEDSAQAFLEKVDKHPEQSIKLGVEF